MPGPEGGNRSLTRDRQLEALEKLFADLRSDNALSPVLVEGDRDVAALRNLGLEGTILKLNAGESLVQRADRLSAQYPRIILLTDWDAKGTGLHARLRDLLEDCEVEADDRHWLRLRRLCGRSCRTIEDLPSRLGYLRRMAAGAA